MLCIEPILQAVAPQTTVNIYSTGTGKHFVLHYISYLEWTNVPTDLHIYNLDTVPPTDVVWNDVATDKLTTQDGDKFRTGAGVVAAPHRLTPVLPRHTT